MKRGGTQYARRPRLTPCGKWRLERRARRTSILNPRRQKDSSTQMMEALSSSRSWHISARLHGVISRKTVIFIPNHRNNLKVHLGLEMFHSENTGGGEVWRWSLTSTYSQDYVELNLHFHHTLSYLYMEILASYVRPPIVHVDLNSRTGGQCGQQLPGVETCLSGGHSRTGHAFRRHTDVALTHEHWVQWSGRNVLPAGCTW